MLFRWGENVYTEKIDRFFRAHREEFLTDLAQLVAVNSVKGEPEPGKPYGAGPARALELALGLAERYGLYTENWENRLGIVQLTACQAHKLDILVHLDVVPASAENWTVTEPFQMKEADGRVYGRGTMDDKGPALAVIYALRAIQELGLPCKEPVRIVLGCDEENGSSELPYYFSKTQAADMTLSPDAGWPVVNLEKGILTGTLQVQSSGVPSYVVSVKGGQASNAVPGQCEIRLCGICQEALKPLLIRTAERTRADFTLCSVGEELVVQVSGIPAHAAMPEKGNNAVTAALEFLAELPDGQEPWTTLAALFPHGDFHGEALGVSMEHPLSGPLTLSLNVIAWEKNGLRAVFDSRLPIGFGPEQLRKLETQFQDGGFAFAHSEAMPHYVPKETPFIQTLLESYEEFSGQKGFCRTIGGLTYCHGIENAVAFGMEREDVDHHLHGNDEFAIVSELLRGGKIYTSAILRLCGGGSSPSKEENI